MATMTANGRTAELAANGNGQEQKYNPYQEIGSIGISGYSGFITEAYNAKLHWPAAEAIYTPMWRSDPEIAMARIVYSSLSGQQDISVEIPERIGQKELAPPTDDDKRAADFAYEVLEDIEGGISQWFSSCMARVPFYGFGVWEAPVGLRRSNWKAPKPLDSKYDDPWRSEYDDGLTGYRRLAFRSYASFYQWDMDDYSGRVHGLIQNDPPNPQRTIPISQCLHIRYGDLDNPEGLATMETIWRLEYIKRALETVFGIGAERSAGYVKVNKSTDGAVTDTDLALIRQAARALMSAQEGNYGAWPFGWDGNIIDTPFAAGSIVKEMIAYFGMLKLAALGMQFIAMSTISGAGSYAALDDSSSVALLVYNSISQGIIKQADEQIIKRLFAIPSNAAAFPNMTRRPRLTVSSITKRVSLAELGQFATAMKQVMQYGDEDLLALRRYSTVLPEKLPEIVVEPVTAVPDVVESVETSEDTAEEGMEDMPGEMGSNMEMAQKVVASFARWAEENEPETAAMLAREM